VPSVPEQSAQSLPSVNRTVAGRHLEQQGSTTQRGNKVEGFRKAASVAAQAESGACPDRTHVPASYSSLTSFSLWQSPPKVRQLTKLCGKCHGDVTAPAPGANMQHIISSAAIVLLGSLAFIAQVQRAHHLCLHFSPVTSSLSLTIPPTLSLPTRAALQATLS